MTRFLLAVALILASTFANAQQQSSSAKREEIRQLLLIAVGSQAVWYAMAEPIIEPAKKLNPDAPPTVWAELSSYLKDVMLKAVSGPEGFFERVIVVFDREFSDDEIKQIAAFVRSDLGRKYFMANSLLAIEMERDQAKILAAIIPGVEKALTSFFASRGLKRP